MDTTPRTTNRPAGAELALADEPLSDDLAAELVAHLKAEADRHWAINAHRSLELADQIVEIGTRRGDRSQMALGTMARGDALKLLGQCAEAWTTLDHAGELFRAAGDEIGWARTRIGRLGVCVDVDCVAVALAEAAEARAIFERHGDHEKRIRLELNTAVVHTLLGNSRAALELYNHALELAEALGEAAASNLGPIYTNTGFTHEALGDFSAALRCHEQARELGQKRGEHRLVALAETNIAIIAMRQGRHRHALQLLHRAHALYVAEHLEHDAAELNRIMVECYLLLNRNSEARDLARAVSKAYRAFGEPYQEALTLLELATAEGHLGAYAAAQEALAAAEPIFANLQATGWVAIARLRAGQIALLQNDPESALREATAAAEMLAAAGQQSGYGDALLLQGQALLELGTPSTEPVMGALEIAQRGDLPALRYGGHLLLGRIAEAQGDTPRALRRYQAAAVVVERTQQKLTITLRPSFLQDKEAAIQALLAIYLRHGDARRAFQTLERMKSQVLLSHLTDRDQVRWLDDGPRTRELSADLERLRAEHQWFYEIAHDQLRSDEGRAHAISQAQAIQEVRQREQRMRSITEQLYLLSAAGTARDTRAVPAPEVIQRTLAPDTLLLEFYNDGRQLWVFTLTRDQLGVHPLPITVAELEQSQLQLQLNVAAALKAGPEASAAPALANLATRLLQRLYRALLAPIGVELERFSRLIVVPFGALHYLPFHLLHDGRSHLIERREVVTLPAAGLLSRPAPVRPGGARVLAHSWDRRLPYVHAEARAVQRRFGGELLAEQAATRAAISAPPCQILHIAAHGEHRLDQPDLSYIQLADGQLYTDDLLQQDLSYELVTLSACETGRARVAPGDELIGLGRGFLYAGAGALIASQWRVPDAMADVLMNALYLHLEQGASKAAALRQAQRALLAAHPGLHPAFWGAFQLIGDAAPLSQAHGPTA